jgi:hypothetical protein
LVKCLSCQPRAFRRCEVRGPICSPLPAIANPTPAQRRLTQTATGRGLMRASGLRSMIALRRVGSGSPSDLTRSLPTAETHPRADIDHAFGFMSRRLARLAPFSHSLACGALLPRRPHPALCRRPHRQARPSARVERASRRPLPASRRRRRRSQRAFGRPGEPRRCRDVPGRLRQPRGGGDGEAAVPADVEAVRGAAQHRHGLVRGRAQPDDSSFAFMKAANASL